MSYRDSTTLHRRAQELRREELGRIASSLALKWQTFWKARHAPHPSKVPTPTHP